MPPRRRAKEEHADNNKDSTGSSSSKNRTNSYEHDHMHEQARPQHEPILTSRRILLRLVFVLASVLIARFWFSPDKPEKADTSLAAVGETVAQRVMDVPCSKDYKEDLKNYPDCTPRRCSRVVTDNVVTPGEASRLLNLAKRGLSHGGSNGGASILDLHSGALSAGSKFVNIYKILEDDQDTFTEEDFKLYKTLRMKIHQAISQQFGVSQKKLFLTKPTFFSRMNARPAKSVHDEYWHPHVDKETYGSFDYTSLLYLSDYNKDFTGGRFIFVDKNQNTTVEPKIGRLSFFTSGSENLHYVEPVESGTRYAITVSFTCDPESGITDPVLKEPG